MQQVGVQKHDVSWLHLHELRLHRLPVHTEPEGTERRHGHHTATYTHATHAQAPPAALHASCGVPPHGMGQWQHCGGGRAACLTLRMAVTRCMSPTPCWPPTSPCDSLPSSWLPLITCMSTQRSLGRSAHWQRRRRHVHGAVATRHPPAGRRSQRCTGPQPRMRSQAWAARCRPRTTSLS